MHQGCLYCHQTHHDAELQINHSFQLRYTTTPKGGSIAKKKLFLNCIFFKSQKKLSVQIIHNKCKLWTVWKEQFIKSHLPLNLIIQPALPLNTHILQVEPNVCTYYLKHWLKVCLWAESTVFFIEIQFKKQKFISIGLSLPLTSLSDHTELISKKQNSWFSYSPALSSINHFFFCACLGIIKHCCINNNSIFLPELL